MTLGLRLMVHWIKSNWIELTKTSKWSTNEGQIEKHITRKLLVNRKSQFIALLFFTILTYLFCIFYSMLPNVFSSEILENHSLEKICCLRIQFWKFRTVLILSEKHATNIASSLRTSNFSELPLVFYNCSFERT